MFTRAGYNVRGAHFWEVWARVSIRGFPNHVGWAQILEFGAGDLAWFSKPGKFLIWGLRAEFVCKVHADWTFRRDGQAPRSSLRTRELVTGWGHE